MKEARPESLYTVDSTYGTFSAEASLWRQKAGLLPGAGGDGLRVWKVGSDGEEYRASVWGSEMFQSGLRTFHTLCI